MVSYAMCFNSSTIGVIMDYKNSYYEIRFPHGTMWVHENNVINMWNGEDDDESGN